MLPVQEIKIRATNGIGLSAEETVEMCDKFYEYALATERLDSAQRHIIDIYEQYYGKLV